MARICGFSDSTVLFDNTTAKIRSTNNTIPRGLLQHEARFTLTFAFTFAFF
jgi:hypothetical protein